MALSKENFMNCMKSLSEVYNKELTDCLFLIYWDCLKVALNDEQLMAAVKLHITNSDKSVSSFFPKPADLLVYARENHEHSAMQAWQWITGGRKDLARDDWRADKAMRMIGGWQNFSMVKVDDLPYRAKDFMRAYVLICEKEEKEEVIDDTKALHNIMKQLETRK